MNSGYEDDQTRSFVPLAAGTQVSHYKVISKIGAGGMGEVYLAEDNRLSRKVALKFLANHLCQSEAARNRFIREAKAAAKLDHPNIVPIHEVDEFQGRPFFAMAHIEGKSLREVVSTGNLSTSDAIEYTRDICAGLNKAHQSGIVHRDIKPGNIIIDKDNKARILDFGLATVQGEEKLTKTGSTLGTIGYMSPEQIEGKEVDHRSDLFSVGVILYEMLTGKRPFDGDTDVAIIRAIADKQPEPISKTTIGNSDSFQQIIDKALSKSRSQRYQHAEELLTDLKRLSGEPLSARPSKAWLWTTLTVAIVATVGTAAYMIWPTMDDDLPLYGPPEQITFDGDVYKFDVSEDGQYLAYVLGDIHEENSALRPMQLYVQELGVGEPIKIFECGDIFDVAWSPDGSELLISASLKQAYALILMPRLGGSHRVYTSEFLQVAIRDVSWSADGMRFAASRDDRYNQIHIIDKQSGNTSNIDVIGLRGNITDLHWAPNGKWISFVSDGLYTVPIDGGEARKVVDADVDRPRWDHYGAGIYYTQAAGANKELRYIPVDGDTGKPTGKARKVVSGLGKDMDDFIRTSGDTRSLYSMRQSHWTNLYLIDLSEVSGSIDPISIELTKGTSTNQEPQFSPNGRRLAYSKQWGEQVQAFVLDLETGQTSQVTHSGTDNRSPVWSLDGKLIAHRVFTEEGAHVAIVSDLGGQRKTFEEAEVTNDPLFNTMCWMTDGRIVTKSTDLHSFMALDTATGFQKMIGPMYEHGFVFNPVYSDFHRSIAFDWILWEDTLVINNEQASSGIWLMSLEDSSMERLYSRGLPLGWSTDGEFLYFWRYKRRAVLRISMSTSTVDTLFLLPLKGVEWVAMSNDAKSFVYAKPEGSSDIWLMEEVGD